MRILQKCRIIAVDVKLEKADHFNANKDRQYYEKPIADLEDNPN